MTTIYEKTASDIVKKALLLCRAYDPNQSIDATDYQTCLDTLNFLIKSWQSQGYNLWLLDDAVLFLTSGAQSFQIGDDGANCCNLDDFVSTTTTSSTAAAATTINATSVTGMSGAANIYSSEQTGQITLWVGTTQGKSVSGNTLTISNTTAAAGYVVYTINDLTVGNEYRITYGYDDTGGSGAVFTVYTSVSGTDATLVTATQTVTGTYTLDFTATQTTAYLKVQQVSTTPNHTEILTAMNMIDINSGDYLGLELDDSTVQWTRIISISSLVLTVADAITSIAASGNTLFSYSTKLDKPMRIMDGRYQQSSSNFETPIEIVSRKTYMEQTDKVSTGDVTSIYYQPKINSGDLFVWPACNSAVSLIKFGYVKPIEIMEATSDDAMFPSEWFLPLSYSLAAAIAPEYKTPADRLMFLEQKSAQLLESVLTFDNENESLFIMVDYD